MMKNLEPRHYVDPVLYERERQSIFRRHWQMVGPVARLKKPGDYLAVDVAGWKLFALRGQGGVLRGFHNVCRHRGARLLADGAGQCRILRCPYHNWVYDQQGSLIKAPWFGEEPEFKLADWPLEKAVDVAELDLVHLPRRDEHQPDQPGSGEFYGTYLRLPLRRRLRGKRAIEKKHDRGQLGNCTRGFRHLREYTEQLCVRRLHPRSAKPAA